MRERKRGIREGWREGESAGVGERGMEFDLGGSVCQGFASARRTRGHQFGTGFHLKVSERRRWSNLLL